MLLRLLAGCGGLLGVWAQDLFIPSRPGLSLRLEASARPEKPNIVFFLTDDQDQMLGGSFPPAAPGGATPMPKTKRLMQDEGMHATNWYIHTPICSPSRSELLTGRYFHNIKASGVLTVMHVNYSKVYDHSFMRALKEEGGYTTGLFGKYLNEMPHHVPLGCDAWLANSGGDYIAPSFQAKNIEGLEDGHVQLSNGPGNYTTAVVGNTSIAWIKKVAKQGKPFMAYIAPKAAHEPFNPAPWYRDHWDPSWPEHEPRPANWNCSADCLAGHHGNVGTERTISQEASKVITGIFKNRWRTLMSVDDVIAEVIATVDELGLSGSTYFFFTSDHGFQLGQFNIPMDKRHVYEWDTKIHLLARGPGIAPGSVLTAPGTQVDIAPTLLGLAGLAVPPSFDGRSIAPFLFSRAGGLELDSLLPATRRHLDLLLGGDALEAAAADLYKASWRKEVFIEYYYNQPNVKCMRNCFGGSYPKKDSACTDLAENKVCWCMGLVPGQYDCYPTEDRHNNFIAIRRLSADENLLYAEFQTGCLRWGPVDFSEVDFAELYDLSADPWQITNMAEDASRAAQRAALRARLREWLGCAGAACP